MCHSHPIFLWKQKYSCKIIIPQAFVILVVCFLLSKCQNLILCTDSSMSLSKMGWNYNFMILHVFITRDLTTNFKVSFFHFEFISQAPWIFFPWIQELCLDRKVFLPWAAPLLQRVGKGTWHCANRLTRNTVVRTQRVVRWRSIRASLYSGVMYCPGPMQNFREKPSQM